MLRRSSPPDRTPDRRRLLAHRHRFAGQSVVEFALLLPVLLALVGVTIDFARVYQAWTNLESATRDAAQYLASSNVDPIALDYTVPDATANISNDNKAKSVLESETGSTFARSMTATAVGPGGTCNAPTLTTVTGSRDTTVANGGSDGYPVQAARVLSCRPFRTLFAYPFVTTGGAWILQSDRSFNRSWAADR